MKKLLFPVLMLLAGISYADSYSQENSFATTNDTISISSSAVTTISAEYGYKEIYIGDPSTTVNIFYRVDGSTVNIPTTGWWIPAGEGQKIGFNGIIYLQLGAGESSITVRSMRFWR